MTDYYEIAPATFDELRDWFASFKHDDEVAQWCEGLSMSIARHHHAAGMHDRGGFLAHLAYDPECLALGHERSIDQESGELEDVYDDELSRDGTHVPSWDGDYLCADTRYADACTECESDDCEYLRPLPNLWALVATPALAENGTPA